MVKRNGQTFSKYFIRGISLSKLKKAGQSIFSRGSAPTIDSFTSTVQNISLNSRPTGTLALMWQTTGAVSCKVLEQGGQVVLSSALNGSVQIPQPNKTTSYVLTATNNQGSVSSVIRVMVTKMPTIRNLRRTRFANGVYNIGTYEFKAHVTGLPKPTATFQINNGIGMIASNLRPVGSVPGNYELTIIKSLNTTINHRLFVSVVNSVGSDTATIDNINA